MFIKFFFDNNENITVNQKFHIHENKIMNKNFQSLIDAFNNEKENNDVKNLFNFHIDIHFNRIMFKYKIFQNVNFLFDENKHRFFKQIVLSINYRKLEKQLHVQKNCKIRR